MFLSFIGAFTCCFSVTQSCPTFGDPMDCSMPGFCVLHHLLELTGIIISSPFVSEPSGGSHLSCDDRECGRSQHPSICHVKEALLPLGSRLAQIASLDLGAQCYFRPLVTYGAVTFYSCLVFKDEIP